LLTYEAFVQLGYGKLYESEAFFLAYYTTGVSTSVRLAAMVFDLSTAEADYYQTREGIQHIYNITTQTLARIKQDYYSFFDTSLAIAYPSYYNYCNTRECTWIAPEPFYGALLSTLAVVSAIHALILITSRGLYSITNRNNWKDDIGDIINVEIGKGIERVRASQLELSPPSTPTSPNSLTGFDHLAPPMSPLPFALRLESQLLDKSKHRTRTTSGQQQQQQQEERSIRKETQQLQIEMSTSGHSGSLQDLTHNLRQESVENERMVPPISES